MHAAYASAWLPGEDSPPDATAEPDGVEPVAWVLDPKCATPEAGEPPPQPATSAQTATSVAAKQTARHAPPAGLLQ
jgi:hypothetical protein